VIVADTHSWVWWLTDRELLSRRALDALNENAVAISPVTCLEVATLARKRRITLNRPVLQWLQQSVERSNTRIVDLTLAIAAAAGLLESDAVGDPTDRLIIATALEAGVPLVTKDRKIVESGVVPTIW
jgi:PIN domain nuclease of toxin-antitoxin system